jgi:thiol-disulfide isomerase/thioredoxin
MNQKHYLKKAVGILMVMFLLGGLAALPAQAGVVEGNKGKGGQPVDLKNFIKPGQTTIIDFYSQACPPCMKIAPILASVAAKRPNTQVVKFDINRPGVQGIDFDSPLAKQQGLTFVPAITIYDENGRIVAKGQEAINKVLEWNK